MIHLLSNSIKIFKGIIRTVRSTITLFVCGLFVFGGCSLEMPDNSSEVRPPNIVFLFSDDHSVPDLGAYGNSAIQTPTLDRLAEEGVLFNRAYVTSSQCSPSRASILTGRWPHEVGASRLHADAQQEFTSLIEMLNDAGYYTGAYRKVHQQQIQDQLDFYGDADEALTSFFDELPEGRPFFLWFGSTDPHRPYNTGEYEYLHDPEMVIVPDYLPDTPAVRQDLADYYNEIRRFDRESGEILTILEEHGLSHNTMVVMSGDNGLPFPRAKATLYEAGIKVPLIVKWPDKIGAGTVSDELVSLLDLTPTWLEAAGIPVPEEMGGISLIPLFEGNSSDHREFLFAERNWHDNWDPMRAIIGKRYKLIQNYRPEVPYIPSLDLQNSRSYQEIQRLISESDLPKDLSWYTKESRPQVEFYDLHEDPGEWNNLASNPGYDTLVTRYQQILSEWMNQTSDFLPPPQGAFPQGSGLNGTYDVLNAEKL